MAHPTHGSLRAAGHRSHAEKVAHHRAAGGHVDAAEDRKMIAAAVHKHEKHDHPGVARTKFKDGGAVEGEKAATRLDRPGHAKGGRTKGGAKTHVNVIVAPQHPPMAGGPPMAPHPMMPPGAPPPGAAPPGVAGPPGAGGPPPGAMPPRPPMGPPVGAGVPGMRSRGGRTGHAGGGKVGPAEDKPFSGHAEENHEKVSSEPGGGSGLGRLDKIKDYGHKKTGEGVGMKRGGAACE